MTITVAKVTESGRMSVRREVRLEVHDDGPIYADIPSTEELAAHRKDQLLELTENIKAALDALA